ncbi:MAG TPA: radical SAM protein [Candidatus Aphodovivens avistercoris]|nr:radical SAM protein [Candidatus Aphodovivens avistercoris]
MNTDTLVHRPPYDMGCPVLQVTRGCSHGKCRFCDIQEGKAFSVVPFEEILEDIQEIAKSATQLTRRIYLAGGNPFVLPNEHLIRIFDAVEERIPTVNSYGGFARIDDFAKKTDAELAQLAARGVTDLTIGAESGWDELLAYMDKAQTARDLIEQGKRLHAAGIRFTFFYLAGLAGAGRGQQNALESARVFSEAAPDRILVVTLTPAKNWPLAADIASGDWVPFTEREAAEEIRTFIANLTCKTNVIASHDTDVIRFDGGIPQNHQGMLDLLDNYIPKINEDAARRMRNLIHKASF